MRDPMKPGARRELSSEGARARVAAARAFLSRHPEVRVSAEKLAERIAEVGQRRAVMEARRRRTVRAVALCSEHAGLAYPPRCAACDAAESEARAVEDRQRQAEQLRLDREPWAPMRDPSPDDGWSV